MTPSRFYTLMDTMARLSLKADARKYSLGYVWWILEPLLYVAVFYLVFYGILGTRQPDFLMFLAVGKLTFIWFSKSVTQASQSLMNNKGLIGRTDLPKTLFPMAQIQEGLYKQKAVFLLLLVFLLLDGVPPRWSWLLIYVIALVQYLVIVACALVGALLVCWQRDFSLLINLGMVFMLFVSGIFWDVNSIANPETRELVLAFNPIAFLLDSYRAVLLRGESPDWLHLLAVAAVFAAATALLWAAYNRYSRLIARRVVNA